MFKPIRGQCCETLANQRPLSPAPCPHTSIRLPRSLDTHNILHGDTGDHVTLHSGEILGGREFIHSVLLLYFLKKVMEK